MVAFQEGDPQAFDSLYDRYRRPLINYFYKKCYDRALAEDLTQETFIKIIRFKARYKPEAKFRTFLYAVATNHWIDRYRSRKAAPKTVSTEIPVTEAGGTLGDLLPGRETPTVKGLADREAAALVQTAVQGLPGPQQEVFILVHAQGLKYREAADVLDIPVGTVKSRMNAAVARLQGLLGRVLQ